MRKMRFSMVSLIIGVMLFAFGCALPEPAVIYNPSSPVKTIAVLPMLNNTNDVEGPEKLRQAFAEKLQKKGYRVKPMPETNQVLKDEFGITLGKQLDLTNPVELGKKLGVDALVYGTLYDFDEKTTGVLDIRRVKMGYKMVIARDLSGENLSPFANLREAIEKSWVEVLKVAIETIDAEEKAGKLKKEDADRARQDLMKSYGITTLNLAALSVPKVTWGTAGTTFWAAGSAVKGTTKAKGGLVGLAATGAAVVSKMGDMGDLKNAKQMSEYPGITQWVELPQEEREVDSGLGGLGKSFATSLVKKTAGKAFGVFLKAETDEAMRHIITTVPVGPGPAR